MTDSSKRPDRETGRAPRGFLRFVEEHGIALRRQAGVGPRARLDPFATHEALGIIIARAGDLQGLDYEDLERLKTLDARTWSGSGQRLPDGRLLILLNPNQTPERAVITVMEEVAHVHFGHEPSALLAEPTGTWGRRYDATSEDEAYWTAAAALLPSQVIARAVWHRVPASTIATEYGVSRELVEFRIKTLRLWQHYSRQAAA